MGEAKLRMEQTGFKMKPLQPGQQVPVTPEMMKNAKRKQCVCGCRLFTPAVAVHTVSALLSPTGQELIVQIPVLVCLECKEVLK